MSHSHGRRQGRPASAQAPAHGPPSPRDGHPLGVRPARRQPPGSRARTTPRSHCPGSGDCAAPSGAPPTTARALRVARPPALARPLPHPRTHEHGSRDNPRARARVRTAQAGALQAGRRSCSSGAGASRKVQLRTVLRGPDIAARWEYVELGVHGMRSDIPGTKRGRESNVADVSSRGSVSGGRQERSPGVGSGEQEEQQNKQHRPGRPYVFHRSHVCMRTAVRREESATRAEGDVCVCRA